MEWMLLPLKRYGEFSGRSSRQEFWMFFLFQTLVALVYFAIVIMVVGLSGVMGAAQSVEAGMVAPIVAIIMGGVWLIYVLAMIVPNAAVIVRRCHDQGLSGWIGGLLFVLAFLMNIVGLFFLNVFGLVLLILMALPGNVGTNRYGSDPANRAASVADTFG